MKRIIAVVFLLCAFLPTVAYAHSGRTDGDGGHTNHSTGEYHYHHGYEAHDHYDMDGDGDVDCPFDFVDMTGQNSGTSSSSSSSTFNEILEKYGLPILVTSTPKPTATPRPAATPEPPEEDTELSTGEKIFLYTFGGGYAIMLVGSIVIGIAGAVEDARNAARKKRIDKEEREKQKAQFEAEKLKYSQMYAGKQLEELVSFPAGSFLTSDLLPASAGPDWGLYTLFITKEKYHKPSCRYAKKGEAINSYEFPSKYKFRTWRSKKPLTPCSRCKPTFPDIAWVDECRKIDAIKKKYGIT